MNIKMAKNTESGTHRVIGPEMSYDIDVTHVGPRWCS